VYIIYIYENKLYIYIYDLGLCCHENLWSGM
jgi:hypothetical protein